MVQQAVKRRERTGCLLDQLLLAVDVDASTFACAMRRVCPPPDARPDRHAARRPYAGGCGAAGGVPLVSVILRVLALLSIVTIGASCSPARPEPDLARFYPDLRSKETHPLIVIPGLMGSRLISSETGEEVWGADLWTLLTGRGLERLDLPIASPHFRENRDDLVPAGVIRTAPGWDFYGRLIDTLTTAGGYTCVPATGVGPEADCVLFAWDWRRDLVEAAAELDRLVGRVRAVRGDPGLQVDLVAHSAGAMVARYFLRFGGRDVLDREPAEVEVDLAGAAKVRKAVLIGAPNLGSIYGLQRAMRGEQVGLVRIAPEIMATMPSIYQLLPHPERTWMINRRGEVVEERLYEPETWRALREGIFDPAARRRVRADSPAPEVAEAYLQQLERHFARALERGERFHRALSIPVVETPTAYIVFGADCIITPAVCLTEMVDGEPKIRLQPDEVARPIDGIDYERLMLEPGDGRVARGSLLARDSLGPERTADAPFPIDNLLFGCDEHPELPGEFLLRHNLLAALSY